MFDSKKTTEEFLLLWDIYNRAANLRTVNEKEEKIRVDAATALREKIFEVLKGIGKK